jgi:class 3 adenylate cyclase/dienelactone hydrolase
LGFVSHLDLQWTEPDMARFFNRLGSFSQVILFDKAGTGLSDPVTRLQTLDERVEDIQAVMDAAGVQQAALWGESEGGPSALLFAATQPQRTTALVLYGAFPKGSPTESELFELGVSAERQQRANAALEEAVVHWGRGLILPALAPSRDSAIARRAAATFERSSVSPGMARAVLDASRQIDITDVARTVTVPTVVIHRSDELVPVEGARWLATQIPGARFVELPGVDHAYYHDAEAILDESEQFLTGKVAGAAPDRALVTVLFTDIVNSTRQAADLGDTDWRHLLERHHIAVGQVVERTGGRVVKSLGDGVLAAFAGPARAIGCAEQILEEAPQHGVAIRAGVHTGECELVGDDLAGLAVHIGARVTALAGSGEILVSSTVKDLLVGSTMRFSDRGEHELKGVPGRWQVYAVSDQRQPAEVVAPARDHMTLGDRATVRLARLVPGTLRTVARITQPRGSTNRRRATQSSADSRHDTDRAGDA